MELVGCTDLAVPATVMHHVVQVESSFNPYAIGVVGARLKRQPDNLEEAVATARMLEQEGYNFSLGLAQVNRHNLRKYGLNSYEEAFSSCKNLIAGSRILAECYSRSGRDWGKSFSCYYSGNFVTGYRHGYVGKIFRSMRSGSRNQLTKGNAAAIGIVGRTSAGSEARQAPLADPNLSRSERLLAARITTAASQGDPGLAAAEQRVPAEDQATDQAEGLPSLAHAQAAVVAAAVNADPLATRTPETAVDATIAEDAAFVF